MKRLAWKRKFRTPSAFAFMLCLVATIETSSVYGHEIERETTEKLKKYSQCAYSTFATVENTYTLAKTCLQENVEGSFIECGVAAGTQIAAMKLACDDWFVDRPIYLFDSFEGIPLASAEDESQPGVGDIRHSTDVDESDLLISSNTVYPEMGNQSCSSVEQVRYNLEVRWGLDTSSMKFVKGWFQDTVHEEAKNIDKIALLRLDGDLYYSTKVCLEALFPKVVEGGFVIIDDFGLSGCRKAVYEYFEKIGYSPTFHEVVGGLGPVYLRK